MSIKDRVHAGTGDEGWAIHIDGSLRYRGRIVVPSWQSSERRAFENSIVLILWCIQVAQRCIMIFVASITRADEETR